MSEGQPFPDALAAAQAMGIVEPDSSLDVDGWDAASKLVILTNAVLRQPVTLDDVRVTGIRAGLGGQYGYGEKIDERRMTNDDGPPTTDHRFHAALCESRMGG